MNEIDIAPSHQESRGTPQERSRTGGMGKKISALELLESPNTTCTLYGRWRVRCSSLVFRGPALPRAPKSTTNPTRDARRNRTQGECFERSPAKPMPALSDRDALDRFTGTRAASRDREQVADSTESQPGDVSLAEAKQTGHRTDPSRCSFYHSD